MSDKPMTTFEMGVRRRDILIDDLQDRIMAIDDDVKGYSVQLKSLATDIIVDSLSFYECVEINQNMLTVIAHRHERQKKMEFLTSQLMERIGDLQKFEKDHEEDHDDKDID